MWNEKDCDSFIRSKENMVLILVRKRSAAMHGLCKFLSKPRCQFDTWLTSVDEVGIKEREQNLKLRSVIAVESNETPGVIKKTFLTETNAFVHL